MFGRKMKLIATLATTAAVSLALAGSVAVPADAAPAPQVAPVVATAVPASVVHEAQPALMRALPDSAAPLYPCNRPKMRKIKSKSGGGLKTTVYIEQYNSDTKLLCTIVSKVGHTTDSSKLHIRYGSSKTSKKAKVYWRTKKLPSGLCIVTEGSRQTTKHKWEICYG